MGAKDVFVGLLILPLTVIALAAVPTTSFMSTFYPFQVLFIIYFSPLGVSHEECVMCVTCRMGLGLEQGIEIPEATFYIAVGLHLFESHLKQDFNELLSRLHHKV